MSVCSSSGSSCGEHTLDAENHQKIKKNQSPLISATGSPVRQDVIVWLFSLIVVAGLLIAIWACGIRKGWSAQSGFQHYEGNSTLHRLLPEPTHCNETSIPGRYGVNCVAHWYYWKLPPSDVTNLTRATPWLFYTCHQLLIWWLIYRAQLSSTTTTQSNRYSTKLRWFNWAMLGVNGFFSVLHLVQTHWTYDGLSQDLSAMSSQGAVIMMICFIILMEYKDRGFMFMWPNPKSSDGISTYLRLNSEPIKLVRKYHGFAFSWAVIYTFWYHPMENTIGHVLGFLHTAIVMLQGSFAYTDIHLNRYWRLLNETWVLVHATVVAFQTSDPSIGEGTAFWPIFAFGFGFVFAFTQVFSLPFWKRISPLLRVTPALLFVAVVIALSATVIKGRKPDETGFSHLYEALFIPAHLYAVAFIAWLCIHLLLKLDSAFPVLKSSSFRRAFTLGVVVLLYAALLVVSHLALHASFSAVLTMVLFSILFTVVVCITVLLFKRAFGPFRKLLPETENAEHGDQEEKDKNKIVP